MASLNLDCDEGIVLETDSIIWISHDEQDIDNFVLTNKRLYCLYKKSNGLFKKSTEEICAFSLSDIKIINGQAQVQQIKHEGELCLQIQFAQGVEYFSFIDDVKTSIPQWVSAINNVLGFSEVSTSPQSGLKKINLFSSVADSFKNAITASQTFVPTAKLSTEEPSTIKVSHTADSQTYLSRPLRVEEAARENFCGNCGAKLKKGINFCPSCGFSITSESSTSLSYNPSAQEEKESFMWAAQTEQTYDADEDYLPTGTYVQRRQEYVGKIFKCPNCGNTINISAAICEVCGFHLTGKKAIGSVTDFQQQLLKIEMTRQRKKVSFMNLYRLVDATDKQIIALIKSYPIPNTIDDIMEFMHLAVANIDVEKSKKSAFNSYNGTREQEISNAWVGKMQSLYAKAELYFPNESEFQQIKEIYHSIMTQLKMK